MKVPAIIDFLQERIARMQQAKAEKRARAQWKRVQHAWTFTMHGGTVYLAHYGAPVCPVPFESVVQLNDFLYQCWAEHVHDDM